MTASRALLLAALALTFSVSAKEPAKDGKPKSPVKAPTFSMPSLGEIPKAEGLNEKKTGAVQGLSKNKTNDPVYEILAVRHAAGFSAGADGPQPIGEYMDAVDLRGKPPQTERFSTVITIKSPQKVGAPIDVAILDTRGDTVMSATGELSFFDAKGEETRYQIDWDKSPVRGPGEYKVLVRVAGTPMGTWPLKVRNDPTRAP